MKNHTCIIKWATDCLISKGYSIQHPTEIVLETPWSNVLRFLTSKGDVYLKQPAPTLFLETNIIELLADRFNASVPLVIATNNDLYCFLLKDAGQNLRKYLKSEFQPVLLCQAIKEYTAIQRSTENNIEELLALGVPDWRLNKLPTLYDKIIQETEFLKTNGMTDNELKVLRSLSQKFLEQCELLSQYQIPETLVQPDFNTNNVLFNPNTKKMTCIDLGEIAIAHPFFSLNNFLLQATIHEGLTEQDQIYCQLQDVYLENWLELWTGNQLLEIFMLTQKLWPIYWGLCHYRLMISVDLQALKSFYADRPNQLAKCFREYIIA